MSDKRNLGCWRHEEKIELDSLAVIIYRRKESDLDDKRTYEKQCEGCADQSHIFNEFPRIERSITFATRSQWARVTERGRAHPHLESLCAVTLNNLAFIARI